jgi:hypothetical protein
MRARTAEVTEWLTCPIKSNQIQVKGASASRRGTGVLWNFEPLLRVGGTTQHNTMQSSYENPGLNVQYLTSTFKASP